MSIDLGQFSECIIRNKNAYLKYSQLLGVVFAIFIFNIINISRYSRYRGNRKFT